MVADGWQLPIKISKSRPLRIHLIGIGGAGLSAIARVLLGWGHQVSGSDRADSPVLGELAQLGAKISVGHRAENVHGAELVLASSAVPEDNVEVQEARRLGLPILRRREFLAWLTEGYKVVAVAGTHGKSTTTAMIAWILREAGFSPTFIVGGTMVNLNSNAGTGQGSFFVIEADEYDYTFLGLRPYLALVTVVEPDHPDCYPTMAEMREAFARFLGQVEPSGYIVGCGDEGVVVGLLKESGRKAITYGFGEGNTWQALD
ncbi:MAG: UDP-N-acetylmuramate--L-alanine ligase, partial [Chloroflexi bacterium]